MALQRIDQDERLEAQQREGRFDTSDRPLQFEVIPQVCLIADVCHFLRLSKRQFHYLMARQQLALVELAPMDATRRFTGESVAFEIKRRSQPKLRAVAGRR